VRGSYLRGTSFISSGSVRGSYLRGTSFISSGSVRGSYIRGTSFISSSSVRGAYIRGTHFISSGSVRAGYHYGTTMHLTGTASIIGTTWIGNKSGGNYSRIETGGRYVAAGSAQTWDDVVFSGVSLGAAASAPDLIVFGTSGGIYCRAFNGNVTTEQLFGAFELPHSWVEESAIYPHVHWAPSVAGTGRVDWYMEYNVADTLNAYAATNTIIDASTRAHGTAWIHKFASFGSVSMTGYAVGASIVYRLYRNPSGTTDTYGSDAALIQLGFHYRSDTLGSRGTVTK